MQDAVVAVLVADASMSCAALLGPTNALHTHFPEVRCLGCWLWGGVRCWGRWGFA